MELREMMRVMAEEESRVPLPEWFDEFIDYLFAKNQIIFFIDENEALSGYTCLWRYGKGKFKFIKENLLELEQNPIQLSSGKYLHIPFAVLRRDRLDMKAQIIKEIQNRFPDVKSLSWHSSDGEFHILKLGGE